MNKEISNTCKECKGLYWHPDPTQRQENSRVLFGTPIPNACVPSSLGKDLCPYQGTRQ